MIRACLSLPAGPVADHLSIEDAERAAATLSHSRGRRKWRSPGGGDEMNEKSAPERPID